MVPSWVSLRNLCVPLRLCGDKGPVMFYRRDAEGRRDCAENAD